MTDQCNRRSFVKIGAAVGTAWAIGRECLAVDASDVKAQPLDTRVALARGRADNADDRREGD